MTLVRGVGRRLLDARTVVLLVALAVTAGLALAPRDARQGDVQRLMYVHVPSAWLAYLAFFVTFAGSIAFLVRRSSRADAVAAASAEIGLLFTGLAIASGAIWGRATWGVWWDWDPRLTTTAVLFLVFAGYAVLRRATPDPLRRARLSAVMGIIGFANVPIVHVSVLLWRSLHQPPTVLRGGDPSMDHLMLAVLVANVGAFTLIYAALLRARVQLERPFSISRSMP